MRFYAERPGRLLRQLTADIAVVAWVVLVVSIARTAYGLVQQLQGPARTLADAGAAIGSAFSGASRTAGTVPIVGGDLARALGTGTVRRLLDVSDDPAAAWRRDDREVVRGLAEIELRSLGLRPARTRVDSGSGDVE